MKLKVFAKRLALGLAVLLVLVAGLAFWSTRRPWPQVEGTIPASGLGAPVEVIRDGWGVPHIYAESLADLFFAQGFVHAQDRLWQMEFNRRVGSGRLGEILGPALLDSDRFLRTIGLRRAAEDDWRVLSPEGREILEAYAAGVNHFLDTRRDQLPLEFLLLGVEPEPWTPIDSLAWGKLMSLTLSLNHPMELLRERLAGHLGEAAVGELLPPYPADGPVIVPALPAVEAEPAAEASGTASGGTATGAPHPLLAAFLGTPALIRGSNSFVVHGSRTASGAPLLENDTHLGLGMPSVWYENSLHGGGFDVAGFSFPGLPLVMIGHNGHIAWGITNMCSDVQDFYRERLDDPDDPRRYEFRGTWHDLDILTETIALRGAEPVEHRIAITRHGPLMNDVMEEIHDAEPLALAWTSHAGGRLLDGLAALNRAESWEQFRAALALWDSPSLNLTYADAAGHIGYHGTGRVPIRAPGHRGLRPVPGWSGDYEWQGFIPFEEMPHAFDPPAGFLVAANNKVVDDDFPYHLAYDMADAYRAARLTALLEAEDELTVAGARAIQADIHALPAEALRPHLLSTAPANELEMRALELVDAWDLQLRPESSGAAVYEVWLWHLWNELLADELGEELMTFYRNRAVSHVPMLLAMLEKPDARYWDDVATPEVEHRDVILSRTLGAAVSWLAERRGEDPAAWTWGSIHPLTLAHVPLGQSGIAPLEWIFNSATFEAPGDIYTINETLHNLDDPFPVVFGVAQRLIIDLGDLGRSRAVSSSGQTAHAFHPHRDDQTAAWMRVEDHPLLAERTAVEEGAAARLWLVPE